VSHSFSFNPEVTFFDTNDRGYNDGAKEALTAPLLFL
jgi:hypothetical protein